MSGGGKKEPEEVRVPTYFAGVHFVLCRGPIDAITKIFVDNRQLNITIPAAGAYTINNKELFGGMSREGGIVGGVDVSFGNEGVNAYLASKIPDPPAYKGVVSFILRQCWLGNNYYFKQWSFVAKRTLNKCDGNYQWQSELATLTEPPFVAQLAQAVDSDVTVFYIKNPVNLYTAYIGDIVDVGEAEKVAISGFDYDTLRMFVERGVLGTQKDENATPPQLKEHPVDTYITGYRPDLINAVHVIRECLTDPIWGLNTNPNFIDEASFYSAAVTCYNEGLGFGWFWNKKAPLEDFMNEVLKHINGVVYQDKITGIYYFYLIRKLPNLNGLLVLTDNNTNRPSSIHKKQLPELYSSVVVKYKDLISGQDNSVTMSNNALIARQEKVVTYSADYSGAVSPLVAQRLASRDLQAMSKQVLSVNISGNYELESLHIGSPVILRKPEIFTRDYLMRVENIKYGTFHSSAITLELVEDVFDNIITPYEPEPPTKWIPPGLTPPQDLTEKFIAEVPYYIIARKKGDNFARDIPSTSSYWFAYAPYPSYTVIGAKLAESSDAGSNYTLKGELSFCFKTTLAENINFTETFYNFLNINDTTNMDVLVQKGDIGIIGTELITFEGLSKVANGKLHGTQIAVKRAILDTLPASHSIGDTIYFFGSHSGSDQVEYTVGEDLKVKILPVTTKSTLPLAQATALDLTFEGRLHLPYPPQDFELQNTESYINSGTLDGLFFVKFTNRDRILETAAPLQYHNSATGGLGTGYKVNKLWNRIRIYDIEDNLLRSDEYLYGHYYWWSEPEDSGLDPKTYNASFKYILESYTQDGLVCKYPIEGTFTRGPDPVLIDVTVNAPSPATGITSTSFSDKIEWNWTFPGADPAEIQLVICPNNNRNDPDAIVISYEELIQPVEGINHTQYVQEVTEGNFFAWIRTIERQNIAGRYFNKNSEWYPASPTDGIEGHVLGWDSLVDLVTP